MFDKNDILQAKAFNPNLIGPTLPSIPSFNLTTGATEGCLCDCCVLPMQNVLQQLIEETVLLGTIADATNVPHFSFYLLYFRN